ncbi:hypothetical protein [Chamaesiphon sp. OTE_20_metabat_361]|uniref:hypothetical protein n=1 Tax=Chamaesiphon sp. OTE_20_metabat_361 TaxID=2964689 RepID=UPI00286D1D15|nr:hypothetical protein [Chamaesiphon sp. OTE_20_metabat_361]
MKYALLSALLLGLTTIAAPCFAQFSSFSTGVDNCSNLCVKLDLGSSNNDSSFGSNSFNGGFNSGGNSAASGVRWQVGITWRPTAPEISLAEAERVKRQLDDNRSLMTALAEAIAQNKTEMAQGLAILLAPRLGYKDPRKLVADLKEGSMNVGVTKVEIHTGATTVAPVPIVPPPFAPVPQERREGTTIVNPPPVRPPGSIEPSPTTIELR